MTDAKRIFTDIYDRKLWGEGSGGGSSPEASAPYVDAVNRLIAELKPATILDLGCGDGWVASRFKLGGARYIGVDVVDSVIEGCQQRHVWGEFRCLDILEDPLPAADLVLCKEVTQHLCDADVERLMGRLLWRISIYGAIVHCSAMGYKWGDIKTGEFREVCLYLKMAKPLQATLVAAWEYGGTKYLCEAWRPNAL